MAKKLEKKLVQVAKHELSLYELEGSLSCVIDYLKQQGMASAIAGDFDTVRIEQDYEYGTYGDRDRDVLYLIYERLETDEELAKRQATADKQSVAARKAARVKKARKAEEERAEYERLKAKFE